MAADSSLRPAWITARNIQRAEAFLRNELATTQTRLATALIEKDSLKFCTDFVQGIQFNLAFLDDFESAVKATSTPDRGPQLYSLFLRALAPLSLPVLSAIIQFNRPFTKTLSIHSISPEGLDWRIYLTPMASGDRIGGLWAEETRPLEAARLAEMISENLVKSIDPT